MMHGHSGYIPTIPVVDVTLRSQRCAKSETFQAYASLDSQPKCFTLLQSEWSRRCSAATRHVARYTHRSN
jgi:hypothetical protein